MGDHSFPDKQTPTTPPAESALDAAASRGPLHWSEDQNVDPDGAPDQVSASDELQEFIAFRAR